MVNRNNARQSPKTGKILNACLVILKTRHKIDMNKQRQMFQLRRAEGGEGSIQIGNCATLQKYCACLREQVDILPRVPSDRNDVFLEAGVDGLSHVAHPAVARAAAKCRRIERRTSKSS